jgi:outer membrane protein assembly factor BamB/SAM-dependent methyltransferase
MIRHLGFLFLCLAYAGTLAGPVQAEAAQSQLLEATGVKGGLVVVIGCVDPDMLVQLHSSDAFLVQGLDTDSAKVQAAREHIRGRRLYGKVSVTEFDGQALPFGDNLVNLLLVNCPIATAPAELIRILAPRAVAVIVRAGNEAWLGSIPYAKSSLGKDSVMFRKPVPQDIDDWTHYLHGPDNNALAEDKMVAPSRHMQWRAGPMWGRHHDAEKGTYPTMRNVLSARGRLVCLVDQTRSSDMTVPSQWAIVARNAFSGVRLWERDIQVKAMTEVQPKWGLEEVWRQLVLDESSVYSALAPGTPLRALDIDTGHVIRSYQGTEGFSELIKTGSTLLLTMPGQRITAVHAGAGACLWEWEAGEDGELVRITLAAAQGRVFVKTERSVICLDADQGTRLWRRELAPSERKIKLYFPREKLIVKDGVLLVSYAGKDPLSLNRDAPEFLGSHPRVREYGGRLAALSAADGKILWTSSYFPNLEGAPGEIYVTDGTVWLGPDFAEPRDLHTGKVRQQRPVIERLWTDGHHYRCYPGKATSQYILTAKRGIEFIDLDGEKHSRNNWVRGTCRVGVLPCNGLIYAPPHSCGCYSEAKLIGFWALGPEGIVKGEERRVKEEERLEKGPAYDSFHSSPFTIHSSKDWPTFWHDNERSGATNMTVPSQLKQAWRTSLGGRLSAVTVAQKRVFVAQIDAHTVHALDAASGRSLWQYTTGGRVDSPPTVFQGRVLFGSADGYVYCVRATDGALVWRFFAAPAHMQAVAFDQLESLWPVHGSVLVHTAPESKQAVAYVSAGRSSYLDGGIWLYGLDPATGGVLVQERIESDDPAIIDPPTNAGDYAKKISQNALDYKTFLTADRSDGFAMNGALTDVLVADRDSIFMRHMRFNLALEAQQERRMHLYAVSTLLDDYGHNRADWLLGSGNLSRLSVAFPWYAKRQHMSAAHGVCLSFDAQTVWSIQQTQYSRVKPVAYALRASSRPEPVDLDVLSSWPPPKQAKPAPDTRPGSWSLPLAFQPRALIRAGDAVITGGRHQGSGLLHLADAQTGKPIETHRLPASPAWDGMAAAAGCLYIATEEGAIQCLAPSVP